MAVSARHIAALPTAVEASQTTMEKFWQLVAVVLGAAIAAGEAFTAGVEEHTIENTEIHVYGAEKTLADCFKYRNKIGMDMVLEALTLYRENGKPRPGKVLQFAKVCRVEDEHHGHAGGHAAVHVHVPGLNARAVIRMAFESPAEPSRDVWAEYRYVSALNSRLTGLRRFKKRIRLAKCQYD
jgi:hypothetical protein